MTTVYLCWLEALNRAIAGTRDDRRPCTEDSLSFEIGGCDPLPDRYNDRVEALGGELTSSETGVAGSPPT